MVKLSSTMVAIVLMVASFLNLTLRVQEITSSWTVSDVIRLSITPSLVFLIGVSLFIHVLVETVFPSNIYIGHRDDFDDTLIH